MPSRRRAAIVRSRAAARVFAVDPAEEVPRTAHVRLMAVLLATLFGCSRAPESRSAVRVLALGDSFTIGTGSSPESAFPARVAERWRATGCNVELRNVAVNGYSTREIIDRELPELETFAPTWITF